MVQKRPARKRIHPDVEKAVLHKSARRCTLCFHLKGDVSEKIGQIAHLDRDRTNRAEDNLAWMCLDHHSLYDSATKQHKNYTIPEVKSARDKLYSFVAEGGHRAPVAPGLEMQEQERQLKLALFDQRYAVFVAVREFIGYVLRENGNIQLVGPGQYREFWLSMERAQWLFEGDVNKYLADVDKTAREFYASAKRMDKAIAAGDMPTIDRNGELLKRLSALLEQRPEAFRSYLAL